MDGEDEHFKFRHIMNTNETVEKAFGYWGWIFQDKFAFKIELIDSGGYNL